MWNGMKVRVTAEFSYPWVGKVEEFDADKRRVQLTGARKCFGFSDDVGEGTETTVILLNVTSIQLLPQKEGN
jgi:hypothetical protein